MTPEPRVRRATEADIPGIRAVLAETWRDTYGAFLPLEAIERATAAWHAPRVLAAELARANTFTGVAEDESGVVGMVTARGRPEVVEVARLYVRPGAQRCGTGGRLLAAALAAFPGRTRARLEVEAENAKGRAFYLKAGFVAVEERSVEVSGTALRLIVMESSLGTAAASRRP
ncbi:MAG: GNAT family N-acetyltransferase [Trueperaceae bacterium]